MLLKWIGPDGHNLEGYPCRSHDEEDKARIKEALASGLFEEDKPKPAAKPLDHEKGD